MSLKFMVASILLLLLCSEVLSYRLQKREAEEKTVLTQIQEAAKGYMNYVSDMTHSWVEKLKSLDISQQFWDSYNNIASSVGTYKNVFTDQMFHWWEE